MSKDIFDESNEIKSSFVTWGKPGDHFVGTLVGKREVENNLAKEPGTMQTIYEFKMRDGTFHTLDMKKNPVEPAVVIGSGEVWSLGGKKGIDSQMRNVRIGMIVGMKFIEEKPSKQPGWNPLKVIKVYCANEIDTEWVKQNSEQESTAAAAMKADKEWNSLDDNEVIKNF